MALSRVQVPYNKKCYDTVRQNCCAMHNHQAPALCRFVLGKLAQVNSIISLAPRQKSSAGANIVRIFSRTILWC